jgi:transposase
MSFRPGPWCTNRRERWIGAGVFEALVQDLRAVLRLADDRAVQPSAMVLDARTLQSSCESGGRAGYDGAKRRRGSKVHLAVDTLGHLLALRVSPANEDDRAQVGELVQAVQALTGDKVEVAYVDQGYTGEAPAAAAAEHGVKLEVLNCRKPSGALCSCRAAGWWSAPLAGWRASGAWRVITSGCPRPWPACTSLPSLA